MKIKEIIDELEKAAPVALAEPWDNVGLMIGSLQIECSGVIVTLDVTPKVIGQAIDEGCNLIISHHPFFFNPVDRIDYEDSRGAMTAAIIENKLAVYSAHTNLDKAEKGLGFALAGLLEGRNAVSDGLGVLFEKKGVSLYDFARTIAAVLSDKTVKVSDVADRTINKVYVVSGGGADNETYAMAKSAADVFVSGDIKHHIMIESVNDDFPIIEFSHYNSEIIVYEVVYGILKPVFDKLRIIKANQQCPYRVLEEI